MEKLSHAQLSSQHGWSQPAPAEGEAVKGHTGKAQTSTSHSPLLSFLPSCATAK